MLRRWKLIPDSIAGQLLLIELLAGLPALVLFGYWLAQLRRENRQQAHDTARRAVEVVIREHELILDGTRRLLADLAAEVVTEGEDMDCGDFGARVARMTAVYRQVAVVDSGGGIGCSVGTAASPELPQDSRWQRAAEASTEPILRYALVGDADPLHAVALMAQGVRARDPAGRVVVAAIDLNWMNEQGAIAALPRGSAVTLVDENGRILVRIPDPTGWVGNRDVDPMRRIAATGTEVAEGEGVDGVRRVYVFERLDGGATIRAGIPSALAYAQFRRAQLPVILAAFLTILSAFFLSRVAAQHLIQRRAQAISRTANALREGQLGARTGIRGIDELGRTAVALDEMAEKLETATASFRELARRSQVALEDERRRISRIIHDNLGQTLTALRLELERALPSSSDPGKVRELLDSVEGALQSARTAALELRPAMLDDLGLCAAVGWQVEQFGRRSGIACALETDPAADEIDPDAATAIFRILQEALTNVARHADARSVKVDLARRDGFVELDVVDDGRGLTTKRNAPSLGVLGMSEHARAVGGAVQLGTVSPRGTRVHARVPARTS